MEALFWTTRKISTRLPAGTYYATARRENNFGNKSAVSLSAPIRVCQDGSSGPDFRELYIASVRNSERLDTIFVDSYYDICIGLDSISRFDLLGYLVVNIYDTSFTQRTPSNKGGAFNKKSNYIINLSLLGGKYQLFEKQRDGSFESSRLHLDSAGLYTASFSKNVVIDSVSSTIRMRFRLLKEANPGMWQIAAYLFDSNDAIIATKRICFVLHERVGKGNCRVNTKRHLTVVFIAALISVILVVLIKRGGGKRAVMKKDIEADLDRIKLFINENYKYDLSVTQLRQKLKMSKVRYQSVMRAGGVDFQSLVNRKRVEKAKELLLNSDKSITDIGFDVGFAGQATFFRVFRDIEGLSPGQLRKQTF